MSGLGVVSPNSVFSLHSVIRQMELKLISYTALGEIANYHDSKNKSQRANLWAVKRKSGSDLIRPAVL